MGNRRFSRTPDPEKCASPQLNLKTSVMNKFLTTKNSFTNQSIYKAFHVTSVVYVTRIVISNILCVSVSLFFFYLFLLGGESPIFWISDSIHIDWYKKMNLMWHSILKANLLFVPLFVWLIDISIWTIATYPSPNPTTVNW